VPLLAASGDKRDAASSRFKGGKSLSTLMLNTGTFTIPGTVVDLASFREWVRQPDFPEKRHAWWLRNDVWIDMSQEQIFSHNRVKAAFFRTLDRLVEADDLGLLLLDGVLLTNEHADLSGNPDLFFVSVATRQSGRCQLVAGKERGFTEVQGIPDMVLEVVSDGSEEKDLELLRRDYWLAEIPEYWLVDARESPAQFDILRRADRGYTPVRKQASWLKSTVFQRSFRLVESKSRQGDPKFDLEVR